MTDRKVTADEIDAYEVLMAFASRLPKTRGTVAWAIDVLDNADFFVPITDAVAERDAEHERPEPPTTVTGYTVTSFDWVPAKPGELPYLGVAVGEDPARREDRAYAAWDMAFRDGKWEGYTGRYEMDAATAEEERRSRLAART